MKFNFNIELIDLFGKKFEGDTKEVIANTLLNPAIKGNDVKRYALATKIFEQGEIEIDVADFNLVKNCVSNENSGIIPIAKAQILIAFEEYKIK